jgi:MFS family permease
MSISQIVTGMGKFSSFYWTMILFLTSYVAASGAWNNFAADIYVEHFGLTSIDAGKLNSVATALSVLLCPFIGLYVDRHGKSLWICLVGSTLMAGSHAVLCFFAHNYHSHMLLMACELVMGVAQAMVQAAIFPVLATAVPPHFVSTAMGIAGALMNLTMVVFPFLTGVIHDQTGSYVDSMMVFVLQDVFCIVLLSMVIGRRALARSGAGGEEGREQAGGRRKVARREEEARSSASPFPPAAPPAVPQLAAPPPATSEVVSRQAERKHQRRFTAILQEIQDDTDSQ